MDNTYRVTFEGFRWIIVEAFTKQEAVKLAKESLLAWGYEVKGKPTVEVKL